MLLPLLVAAGCAPTRPASYAAAYLEALARYPGTTDVSEAMTDRFVGFFASASTLDPADLYADRLYFSDTLVTTEDRRTALEHLRRMKEAEGSLRVDILDRQVDGQDVYLVWQMWATFTPVLNPVESRTIGVTHLRFAADGRIVLQQDFWDSSEGLYRHLPLLGSLIGAVRSGFSRAAQPQPGRQEDTR